MTTQDIPVLSLLYLDDDPMAIQHLKMMIAPYAHDYEIEYFGSPNQAIKRHQERMFDIVISDLRLGTTTGLEVLRQMKTAVPSSAYILISGDADLSSALIAVNELKALKFIVKPCSTTDLETALIDARQFLAMQSKMDTADLTEAAVNRIELAIARFDQNLCLVQSNSAADQLLLHDDYLSLNHEQQLQSTSPVSTKKLHDDMRGALFSPEARQHPISVAPKNQPATLLFYPIEKATDTGPLKYLDIVIVDVSKSKQLDPQTVAKALNISLSEARVVHQMACGHSLDETAEICNLSLSTVRTYVKNAYAKTGTKRQADLVSLALRTAI